MKASLRLSPTLSIPLDAATETFALLARRGAGKSNAMAVMAEEMYDNGIAWVAIDPKGDWWGLRSSADGKGPGLPVPVFGGLHGDVPIEPTAAAGAYLANLIFDHNLTCVIDVSRFAKGPRASFLVAFFHTLYDRHQAEPETRHLFMEEAHDYIPQMLGKEDGALKEAASKIVLYGRSFGLGATLASQRSARLHNDVLTQVGTLIAMQTTGPPDLKAISLWVAEQGGSKEMLASIPALKPGEAWVWSPAWLRKFEKMKFRQRRTFDSGATPKVGEKRRVPSTLADVDLGAIKDALAETIEKAQATDPKKLQAKVRELEQKNNGLVAEVARLASVNEGFRQREVEPVEVERAYIPEVVFAAIKGLHTAIDEVLQVATAEQELLEVLREDSTTRPPTSGWTDAITGDPVPYDHPGRVKTKGMEFSAPMKREPVYTPPSPKPDGAVYHLSGPERKILTVLASVGPCLKRKLALMAGYSENGGGFNNPLGKLRTNALITRTSPIEITPAGMAALGDYEPLPRGEELLDYWLASPAVTGPMGKILSAVVSKHPQMWSKNDLAEATGYAPNGGGFNNPLGRLRTLGLVTKDSGLGIGLTDDFAEALGFG